MARSGSFSEIFLTQIFSHICQCVEEIDLDIVTKVLCSQSPLTARHSAPGAKTDFSDSMQPLKAIYKSQWTLFI